MRRIQAPFQAISGNFRQNQAVSGKIWQFQAESGYVRENQALFRHFHAKNEAESGKIGQPRPHWIWEISGQGSDGVPRSINCCPFWAELFWVHSIKTKTPGKPQSNRNQWHHFFQDMATLPTSPSYCHSLLNPIKMSACARKHCGRNVFLPAASSPGHLWWLKTKFEKPTVAHRSSNTEVSGMGKHKQTKTGQLFGGGGKFNQSWWENPSKTMTRNCMILPERA